MVKFCSRKENLTSSLSTGKTDGQVKASSQLKDLTNMHPEVVNADSKNEKTLLEDDITLVADECPDDKKTIPRLKRSENSSVSDETNNITEAKIVEAPIINGFVKDDSKMKLGMFKITLKQTPIIENCSSKTDNNILKYSEVDRADDANDSNSNKPYVCYICEKVFSRNSSLKCHIRLHLEGPANILRKNGTPGRLTNETYADTDKEDVTRPARVERDDEEPTPNDSVIPADEGPYKCEQCDREFTSKRGLNRHHGYHNSESRQATLEDEGSDIDLSLVDENVAVDEEEENSVFLADVFVCTECNKKFKTGRAMKIHMAHAHRESRLNDKMAVNEVAESSDMEELDDSVTCKHCGRTFNSQRALSLHIHHRHKLNGSVEKVVEFEDAYEDSIPVEESAGVFECKYCGKYFTSSRSMNIHSALAHRTERIVDENERRVEQAATSEDEDEEFECDHCGRVFGSQRARSIHIASAHRFRELEETDTKKSEADDDHEENECAVCERRFTSIKAYENHTVGVCSKAQLQNGSYVYVCQECPKTYAHPVSMKRHMREHRAGKIDHNHTDDEEEVEDEVGVDGRRRYRCSRCDKWFPSKQSYAGHCRIHRIQSSNENTSSDEDVASVEEAKEFKCPLCENTYNSRQGLAGHIKAHTDRDRSCPISMKTCESLEQKEESKIFECKYCDRTFNAVVGYAGHMKVHKAEVAADLGSRGDKSAVTAVQSPSSNHRSGNSSGDDDISESERWFSCRYCNKKFASSVQLGGHVRKHVANMKARTYTAVQTNVVEDKVYKCDACMQTFTYLSELKNHTTGGCNRKRSFGSRRDENVFKCEYCEQTFLLQCHLQKHMKSRCNVNDLGGEPVENLMNADSMDTPPNKRVRKSTFLNSMYEYEPIVKLPRKSAQKTPHARSEFRDYDNESVLMTEDNCLPVESEELNDEYYETYIEFPASEQFVIQSVDGEEEGFVFEQYDESKGYQCNECEEIHRDKLQMMIHMAFHLSNRLSNNGSKTLTIKADSTLLAPYKCYFCDERFINKKYRKHHLCKRHMANIYKCDICEKLFLYKKSLKRHCKSHMIETKYHCEYCHKCFTSEWFLKRHTKRQCEKRLALEELTQSPPHTETLECTETDSIVNLDSEVTFVDNFDDLVEEEEIYSD